MDFQCFRLVNTQSLREFLNFSVMSEAWGQLELFTMKFLEALPLRIWNYNLQTRGKPSTIVMPWRSVSGWFSKRGLGQTNHLTTEVFARVIADHHCLYFVGWLCKTPKFGTQQSFPIVSKVIWNQRSFTQASFNCRWFANHTLSESLSYQCGSQCADSHQFRRCFCFWSSVQTPSTELAAMQCLITNAIRCKVATRGHDRLVEHPCPHLQTNMDSTSVQSSNLLPSCTTLHFWEKMIVGKH